MPKSIDKQNKGRTAIVMGGSMAGLWTARVLADHFDEVTIVERDQLPSEPTHRPGVPQARQYHILLRRGRQIMQDLFPDLDKQLCAAGAIEADLAKDVKVNLRGHWLKQFASGHLLLSCSRVLLETAIRQRLASHPRVQFIEGAEVTGLRPQGSTLRRQGEGLTQAVTGINVRWRDGSRGQKGDQETLLADFVVDATGRNSRTPKWLSELGYQAPEESVVNSFLGYATRRYKKPANWHADWDMMLISSTPPDQPRGGIIFAEENETWVVLLAGANKDYPPTDEEGFLAYARSVTPEFYEAISAAEPMTPIYGYRRTENQLRHYEKLTEWPENFIVVGDAYCAFNPIYGQGMTVSAMTAVALGEHLAQTNGNLSGFAHKFQQHVAKLTQPVWLLATSADMQWPETVGAQRKSNVATRFAHWYLDQLMNALPHNDHIRLAFSDVNQLIQPVSSLFAPTVMARALAHYLKTRLQQATKPADRTPLLRVAGSLAGLLLATWLLKGMFATKP
ncbi:MAG: FAD-dependent oxidoreductase [Ardenticatenaceae bacterium]